MKKRLDHSEEPSIGGSFRARSEHALKLFREEYSQQHQTKLNRWLHVVGRVIRVVAIPVLFYDWRIALGMFAFGYLIQFLGHAIEGTSPSFFRNPKHLVIGSLNHVVRVADKLRVQRIKSTEKE